MKKRYMSAFAAALAICLLLCACGKSEAVSEDVSESVSELPAESEEPSSQTESSSVQEPDERELFLAEARSLLERDSYYTELLITAGVLARDNAPEVTLAFCDRAVPGIPEAMRYASLQITPRAILSRAAAGIKDRSLILNLPGSPKAAKENLEAVIGALEHGLLMLRGGTQSCAEG